MRCSLWSVCTRLYTFANASLLPSSLSHLALPLAHSSFRAQLRPPVPTSSKKLLQMSLLVETQLPLSCFVLALYTYPDRIYSRLPSAVNTLDCICLSLIRL